MSKSSIESDISTEQRILMAAEQEFINKGFDGARTTAIAQAAGVTHAMFHYYFRTKKSLFERIVSEKINAVQQLMLKAFGHSDKPLFERIAFAISEHLDFLKENPDLPRFIITEMYTDKERMQSLLSKFSLLADSFINDLQSAIDLNYQKGLCRKVDARMLILDMISLNMFAFVASPVVNYLMGDLAKKQDEFIELRKKENIETIKRRLMP